MQSPDVCHAGVLLTQDILSAVQTLTKSLSYTQAWRQVYLHNKDTMWPRYGNRAQKGTGDLNINNNMTPISRSGTPSKSIRVESVITFRLSTSTCAYI